MKKIPFINLADTQVWMVYLMPFNEAGRTDYEAVHKVQQNCIKDKIFGMGWDIDCFPYGTRITEETANDYLEKYCKKYGCTVSEKCLNDYKLIRKGDYVIMRLKNSHYYVGKVSSEGAFYIHKPEDKVYSRFSWGATVERWIEYYNDSEVPSEIVGRFSQRLHSTIQKINPYRQRLLVIAMYEKGIDAGERIFNVPKLYIGENNFVSSLTYMELEDLVALYISERHKKDGYILLPSSCKVSQQNYEFRYVASGKKPITCQVKNKNTISIEHYIHEKSYEKIYIFSGEWNEDEVNQLRKDYIDYPNIFIITPSELYQTLKRYNIFVNNFYDFDNAALRLDELPLDGYKKVEKIKNETEYTRSKDFICFLANDGFFYSQEFGALILSWHVMWKDLEKEKLLIEKICNDLNNKCI